MNSRKPTRRSLTCLALLAGTFACSAAPASAEIRPADPIVVTGAATPSLLGAAPDTILAFRRNNGAWEQIPVQVDERAVVSLKAVYADTSSGADVTALEYTDPGTFTGPDPDPTLDADDEIALMARDSGERDVVPNDPGGTTGSGLELRITDPLDPAAVGYVYLYRGDRTRDPGAGRRYVAYDFGLVSGGYKTTYRRGVGASPNGPNPENSSVSTPYYADHFSDRWTQDGLKITTAGSTGVDILDRHKNLFAPGNCGRSEDTFSAAEGAFIVNKSGPVRAIRGYLGANSGPYTQRVETFYDRRQDIHTNLRVHTIGMIMDFFDYSPAATGMIYRNGLNSLGVTIDGVPDTVATGPVPFEQVSGPQGGMSIVSTLDTDMPVTRSSYYLDDSTPTGSGETQCTGDSAAYGSSGTYLTSGIGNTDPRLTPAGHHLASDRILFFEPANIGADQAQRRDAQIANPLQVTASRPPAPKSAAKIRLKRHAGARILLAGTVCPGGGARPVAKLQKRARSGRFHAIRGLKLKKGKACWQLRTRLSKRHAAYRVTVAVSANLLAGTSRIISVKRP